MFILAFGIHDEYLDKQYKRMYKGNIKILKDILLDILYEAL